MALICPIVAYLSNCMVYTNWMEKAKDVRIDIIIKEPSGYNCLALSALDDPETGIPMGDSLSKRLVDKKAGCALIEILNNSLKK